METLLNDIRYALRLQLKNPGFTFVALLTLALAIGATSAIFSVVNGVLLEPLPYTNSQSLVMVWENDRLRGTVRERASGPDFFDFKEQNQVFEKMAGFMTPVMNLTRADGDPDRVRGALVSHTIFSLLGVQPIAGRTFNEKEDHPGGERVVVIGEDSWRTRFGGDPGLIGKTIGLDGIEHVVIGVMPAKFQFPSDTLLSASRIELWAPMRYGPASGNRGQHNVAVIAALKPGVTLERGREEMSSIAAQLEKKYPDDNLGRGVFLAPLREEMVGSIRRPLLILLGAVLLVLLIACVNIANLQLARAMERAKEVAIRTALGAGGTRLVRQFMTESLMLTLAAGALGFVLAAWGVDLLVALAPPNLLRVETVELDLRVLGFTSLISILCGIAFGLVPAFDFSRPDVQSSLKESGRAMGMSRRRQRLRDVLVFSEVALSVVLVIGAGLLIKSFWHLQQVDPGFRPDNIIKAELQLPSNKYRQVFAEFPRWPQVTQFYGALIERAKSLPGVESAALAHNHPLDPGWTTRFTIVGRPPVAAGQQDEVRIRPVSSGYFTTVGIPLLRGRFLAEQDHAGAPPVAIINESMARKYFANENPVGMKVGYFRVVCEIVGVVGNERFRGLGSDVPPALYPSLPQTPFGSVSLLVRTASEPTQIISALRREVMALDRDLPIFDIALMENLLSGSVAQPRFNMLLLGIFAAVALVLAIVGVYGLLNYSVTQRTHEIGVRMALGAQRGDVLRLIAARGLGLVTIGVIIGLAAAAGLTRLMSSLLFGITATDPLIFACVPIILVVAGLCASYLPARRATKVDPLIALRDE